MYKYKIMAGEGSPITETLQNIIDYAEKLRLKAESYRDVLRNVYPNLDAFRTITNNMYMVRQIVKYYLDFWSKKRKNLVQTDCEQINRILTLIYIHCFSVVEFHIKELIRRSDCELFKECKMDIIFNKKPVHLSGVIRKSENEIITKHERKVWDILREIRNAAVHNNAFFTKDNKVSYKLNDRDITIEYHKMDYLRGDLDLLLTLIEILMELFHNWVEKFLKLG